MYSTGNYIHHLIITYNGKESEKAYIYRSEQYNNHFTVLLKYCESTIFQFEKQLQRKINKIPKPDRLMHGFRMNFKVFLWFLFWSVLFCLALCISTRNLILPFAMKVGSPNHWDTSKLPLRSSFGIMLYLEKKKAYHQ